MGRNFQRVEKIINECPEDCKFYGVSRGGQIVAVLTNRAVDTIEEDDIIIDDVIDSGKTKKKYDQYEKPFIALYDMSESKGSQNVWLVFPWELKPDGSEEGVEDNVTRLTIFWRGCK